MDGKEFIGRNEVTVPEGGGGRRSYRILLLLSIISDRSLTLEIQ